MQNWTGNIDVTAGQSVMSEVKLVTGTDGIVSVSMLATTVEFSITGGTVDSTPCLSDVLQSVVVASLSPEAEGYALRVTVEALSDGVATADWLVVSGSSALGFPVLTVG